MNISQNRVCRLIYHSVALRGMNTKVLTDILSSAEAANAAKGITGALAYSGGRFLQLLEGPAVEVTETFAKIASDDRHSAVCLVSVSSHEGRMFSDWDMCYFESAVRYIAGQGKFDPSHWSEERCIEFFLSYRLAVSDHQRRIQQTVVPA